MKYLLLTAVLALAPLQNLFAESAAPDAPPYRIGVFLPLTGKAATIGVPLRQGVELAQEHLAREKNRRIVITIEDDEGSAAKTLSGYQRLRAGGGLDAAIVFGSGIGNPVAPVAERDRVVLLALVASDEKVWRGRNFVFSHWMPSTDEAVVMAQEIKARGYKRIGRIGHEQEGINALDHVFDETMIKHGLADRIVLKEKFLIDTVDYRSIILRARALGVDALQVTMIPGAAVFAKQARELGLTVDLFGFHVYENDGERIAGGPALVGSWYVSQDNPAQWFTAEFTNRFGNLPGMGVANAYDSVMLLAAGAKQHGNDSEKIAAMLRTLRDYQGASGVYSANGDSGFSIPAVVKTITAAGFSRK